MRFVKLALFLKEEKKRKEIQRYLKEATMKSSIRDKAEGALHQVKGSVKETAGKLAANRKLEAEGSVEKVAGKAQTKVGQVKKVLGK